MKLKVISTGSQGNAYILDADNEVLLIECGVRFTEIKKALDFDLSKVVGCLITHEHLDHCKSAVDVMKSGITAYATLGTFKAIGQRGEFANHRAESVHHGQTFRLGSFKIMAFDVKHDAAQPVAFLIEHPDMGKTLFLTDTYYCKYVFPGLNNIIIEANFSMEILNRNFGPDTDKEFLRNRVLKSHFSLENCMDMLAANDLSKVNNIVLIHLSNGNSDERDFQQKVSRSTGKNVVCAFNGMEMNFNKNPF